MPIRSPRRLYEVEEVTENVDDVPDAIDPPGGTVKPLFILMKEAIGEFLGLEPIGFNDPRLIGTFGGNGLNAGSLYRKKVGGYRVAGYTLISVSKFSLTEKFFNKSTDVYTEEVNQFKTMTIGFPKGHTVHEVITWLAGLNNFSEIRALRTPAGRTVDLYDPT